MHGVARHHSAFEREQDTRGKHRIEKTIGVAGKQETFDAAITRVKREFTGDVIRSEWRAAGKVFLDPKVLPGLPLKDFLRFLHPAAREIFALGDDADADHVVVQRNVPEPAFFRNERHRGRAGVNALVALGALVVSPDGHLVQFRVADAPVVSHSGEGFATGTIECDGRAVFGDPTVFVLSADTRDAFAFFHQLLDASFLFNRRALFAGIVEQHRWMTADEFNETYALCHFLPGPNVVNLSVVFGSRFRGIPGSIAAFAGLLGPPVVIMTILAALYARYGEIDALRRILAGVSCAAVGLLLSAVFRMMMPLVKRRDLVALVLLAAVFVAIGLLRLPLAAVLLVAIPLSIAITFAMRRRVPA